MDKFKLEKYKPVLEMDIRSGVFNINDCLHIADMKKDPNGEWVKWEDVKILLVNMTGTLDKVLTGLHDMDECTSEMIKKAREN